MSPAGFTGTHLYQDLSFVTSRFEIIKGSSVDALACVEGIRTTHAHTHTSRSGGSEAWRMHYLPRALGVGVPCVLGAAGAALESAVRQVYIIRGCLSSEQQLHNLLYCLTQRVRQRGMEGGWGVLMKAVFR